MLVVMTGDDPVRLTEYPVIFSAVALRLTDLPILLVANDPAWMDAHVLVAGERVVGIGREIAVRDVGEIAGRPCPGR